MDIEFIDIYEYKGLERFETQFKPGVNIIIGKNGAGKSTLISAVCKALSFIFSNDKSLGNDFLSYGNSSLNVRSFKESDYHFNPNTREFAPAAKIRATARYGAQALNWELFRRNLPNASLNQPLYKDAFVNFMKEWKSGGQPLPVLSYYSDSYPHKDIKLMKYALDRVNNAVMPRNFGYYQWDDEASCTSIWETRLCNCLNRVQPYYTLTSRIASELHEIEERHQGKMSIDDTRYLELQQDMERIETNMRPAFEEIEFVESRLKRFSEALPGVEDHGFGIDYIGVAQTFDGFRLMLHFKNGAMELLQNLPAGYRRLYSIVLDLAYRAYILNGDIEPKGIAIIDEIDLHLHPELEKDVMNKLRDVFPQMQFIVTTHSPMVITNFELNPERDQILQLEVNGPVPSNVGDIYGLDYNTGVEDVMGVSATDAAIDNLVSSIAFYELNNLPEQASNVRELLVSKLKGDESAAEERINKRKREMAK